MKLSRVTNLVRCLNVEPAFSRTISILVIKEVKSVPRMEIDVKYTDGSLNVFRRTFLALKHSKQSSGADTKQSVVT
jgi:hypothetical protein